LSHSRNAFLPSAVRCSRTVMPITVLAVKISYMIIIPVTSIAVVVAQAQILY
jgi:hypothetical protein